MNIQPDKIQQTKKNLMDAFWRLYETKKIEKITIKDITEKAGYNRSTFYQYFKDVYDVLDQIELALLPDISKDFLNGSDKFTPDQLVSNITKTFQRNSKYLSVLLGDHGDPQFALKMKSIILPIMHQLVAVDFESKHFRYIFEYYFSALIGVLTYWVNNDKQLSTEELTTLLMEILSKDVKNLFHTQIETQKKT